MEKTFSRQLFCNFARTQIVLGRYGMLLKCLDNCPSPLPPHGFYANAMLDSLFDKILDSHSRPKALPGQAEIDRYITSLLQFLFPELSDKRLVSEAHVRVAFDDIRLQFEQLLHKTRACSHQRVDSICRRFFDQLEDVYDQCLEDAEAILMGDPSAFDLREVIRSFPGFYAIAIYRIAHLMWQLEIPYLPRIFTEYAHSRTGIDIHPGAVIGRRFCIDHGTGIVIGETSVIGNNVKIYQGVTLGAMSVSKEMAKTKRHPNIEDHVVIYAGATILGGQTTIGAHSIIGGNVWLTESIAPYSRVYYAANDHHSMTIEQKNIHPST